MQEKDANFRENLLPLETQFLDFNTQIQSLKEKGNERERTDKGRRRKERERTDKGRRRKERERTVKVG